MKTNKGYALITGASSGFGKATALQLAAEGYDLLLLARRKDKLNKLKDEILARHADRQVELIVADVRDYSALTSGLSPLIATCQIHVLVNNAGLALGLSEISGGSREHWETMIDTNIKGLLHVTQLILPAMIARKEGYIINISSIAGKEVYANGNVYCATKHAVDAINKALRLENAKYGIRVTAINPGAAETEFSIVRFEGDKARADNVYNGFTPLYAEDIAETIAWLLSRPKHVNMNEITIMPTAQPMAGLIHRE
jgi:3-hydroxy acid dehydrogenase/malonic semialdehyde reductase